MSAFSGAYQVGLLLPRDSVAAQLNEMMPADVVTRSAEGVCILSE